MGATKVRPASGPLRIVGSERAHPPVPTEPDPGKLRVPTVPSRVIHRTALVQRLIASEEPFVGVIAPAGYGKTTLLAEWATSDPRPVVWISVDERDDDPAVLLAHLALALNEIRPLQPEVFASLRARRMPVVRTAVSRIGEALRGLGTSVLIAMDDVHALSDPQSIEAVSLLTERLQPGSQLAVSARGEPGLPLARMRAEGKLLEITMDDLALTVDEAALVIAGSGVRISEDDVLLLRDRTEGWPAALCLAALSLKGERDIHAAVERFSGRDRLIVDYLREELLGQLPRRSVRFLTRTAVLRRMCGPLCDAVLVGERSARMLESLERSNRLVVALDRERRWYRYQEPLRGMLLAELRSREPEMEAELNRRAADWSEANGHMEDAIEHAHGAGDPMRAGRYVAALALASILEGRLGTVRRWLERFDEEALAAYPPLALAAAWAYAFMADPRALHWLSVAEQASFEGVLPDGSASLQSALAFLRAVVCAGGVDAMMADAATMLDLEGPGHVMRPNAMVILGTGLLLAGLSDAGLAMLRQVVDLKDLARPLVRVVALTELAIAEVSGGAWANADSYVGELRRVIDLERLDDAAPLAAFAVSAVVAAHGGDGDRAVEELDRARRRSDESTFVIPWLAVQGRLCMARAFLALADPRSARTALEEARAVLNVRPSLGVLRERADEMGSLLERWALEDALGPSTLTPSELRLLPLLSTYLSFREVGERLFVSTNTVKSQVMSIYRKLRVSSRAEAVTRARELGLADLPSTEP